MTKETIIQNLKDGFKYSRFCGKIYIHNHLGITRRVSSSYKLQLERMIKNGDLENVGTWIKLKN